MKLHHNALIYLPFGVPLLTLKCEMGGVTGENVTQRLNLKSESAHTLAHFNLFVVSKD